MMSRTLLEVLIVLVVLGIAWQIALTITPLLRSYFRDNIAEVDEAHERDEELLPDPRKDNNNGSS